MSLDCEILSWFMSDVLLLLNIRSQPYHNIFYVMIFSDAKIFNLHYIIQEEYYWGQINFID